MGTERGAVQASVSLACSRKRQPTTKGATAWGPGSTATIKELTVSDHEHDVGLGGISNGHRGSHEDEQGRHFGWNL